MQFPPGVRPALESDTDRILQLIVDLATYERAAHEVRATADQLRAALFGPSPAAYALVAEADDQVVGFALYFLNFSTWEGTHGIYLEDLFVEPGFRGTGLGKALLQGLATIAHERGYARVEWSVLNWNSPSIDFYARLGAVAMDDWTVFRLTGPALRRLVELGAEAAERDGAGDRQNEAENGPHQQARRYRVTEQGQPDQ